MQPGALDRTPGGSSGGTAAAVAAGLVGAGLGSDAGGSIRCPSAYCGLFGLKTQRGRVPLAPSVDAWLGLSVDGVLTRSVADSALFHDAIAEGPADPGAPPVPHSSFLAAIGSGTSSAGDEQAPRALRIAVASRLPPSPLSRLHADNRAALEETVVLLRRLGHEVNERELDYGPIMPPPEFTVRMLRSRHEDAVALAHPERLERRMRAISRLGGLLHPRHRRLGARQGDRLCGAAERGARRARPAADARDPGAPAEDRRVRGSRLAVDDVRGGRRRLLPDELERHRPARLLGAGRVRAGRAAPCRAARGEAERRGDAVLARRPARGGATLGGAPPAALLVSAAPAGSEELLEVAVEAARTAGALLCKRAGQGLERDVRSKSTPTDLVSEADLASEHAVRELLHIRRPEDGFLGRRGDRRRARAVSAGSWIRSTGR